MKGKNLRGLGLTRWSEKPSEADWEHKVGHLREWVWRGKEECFDEMLHRSDLRHIGERDGV